MANKIRSLVFALKAGEKFDELRPVVEKVIEGA